jgi:hypothetical protein
MPSSDTVNIYTQAVGEQKRGSFQCCEDGPSVERNEQRSTNWTFVTSTMR